MRIYGSLKHNMSMLSAAILVTAASFPTHSVAAQGDEEIHWRVQTHYPSSSNSYEDSIVRLKNQLAECTDGQLVLDVFGAGALFSGKETFNAVKRGTIPMGTIAAGYLPSTVSSAGIAGGLPFTFRNVWEAAYFHKIIGFEEIIRDEVAEQGVYYSTDRVNPTELVVKEPIQSLEDFKRLKLRSFGAMQRFLTEAGAAATYLPGEELYPALATGVVDGAHWGAASGAYSMGLYEIAKYHVKPALTNAGNDAWLVNQEALDELPANMRDCVIDELDEQFWVRTNEYQYIERIALANAKKEYGVQVNTLPPEVQNHLTQVAIGQWEKEGKKGPEAQKALTLLKDFLTDLGHLER